MAKQGKDTAEVFASQGRQDLADEYLAQVEVYNKYLPQMMSDAELTEAVNAIIAQVGATSPKDMGKVMGTATKQLSGRAEGKGRALARSARAACRGGLYEGADGLREYGAHGRECAHRAGGPSGGSDAPQNAREGSSF